MIKAKKYSLITTIITGILMILSILLCIWFLTILCGGSTVFDAAIDRADNLSGDTAGAGEAAIGLVFGGLIGGALEIMAYFVGFLCTLVMVIYYLIPMLYGIRTQKLAASLSQTDFPAYMNRMKTDGNTKLIMHCIPAVLSFFMIFSNPTILILLLVHVVVIVLSIQQKNEIKKISQL